ncbi:MAG: glycosyl transferase family 1 [Verrucomicrobia bacterium]|nr:glycosyl transferase family 1 [Verrucomicrobiota bacterium]
MKILFLAPHPFYQERGTPIAVRLLVTVLSELGHSVDILTYHEGEDLAIGPNVRIHRIGRPALARQVRPGFSIKKLICDAHMYPMAVALARANKYDIVHAVEESVFMAMTIRRRFGIPYVFDMDSSMPRQIVDKLPLMKPLFPFMAWREARAITKALAVVPMCEAFADLARRHGATRITVLRDISLLGLCDPAARADLRKEFGIKGACYLYLGNLEKYQGIDLLLESFAIVAGRHPDAGLVIAGGIAADIEKYRGVAARLGIAGNVHFAGPKPLSVMKALFDSSDALVSPRTHGENTPMKIYPYLDSGKPIIATRAPTHTQVLNDSISILVEASPAAFAGGLMKIITDPAGSARIAANAKDHAGRHFSFDVFRKQVAELYKGLADELHRRQETRH